MYINKTEKKTETNPENGISRDDALTRTSRSSINSSSIPKIVNPLNYDALPNTTSWKRSSISPPAPIYPSLTQIKKKEKFTRPPAL